MNHIEIYPRAIKGEEFMDYVSKLRAKHKKRPLALFMDQLKVHQTEKVRKLCKDKDILPVYNLSYSPELNPIESVFSRVKAIFKRQRLNFLVNKLGFNFDRTIRLAFDAVE